MKAIKKIRFTEKEAFAILDKALSEARKAASQWIDFMVFIDIAGIDFYIYCSQFDLIFGFRLNKRIPQRLRAS